MALGDIGAAQIDSLTLETTGLGPSKIMEVGPGVYAVAYSGLGGVGMIRTFPIDAAGNIGLSIDFLQFDVATVVAPSIIKVVGSADIYMIVYQGPGVSDGHVATVDIDAAGNIGGVIDTMVLATGVGVDACWARYQNLLHIAGNVYAYAYQNGFTNLRIRTFDCDNLGNLGAIIDTKDIAVGQNMGIEFQHVAGDVYWVAHCSLVVNSRMYTFIINDNGTFGADIDNWQFDLASAGYKLKMISIGPGVYALAWYSNTGLGLGTFAMTDAGIITPGFIDTVNYPADQSGVNDFMLVSGEMYALSWITDAGVNHFARVETRSISAAGAIAAEHDHLDYHGSPCLNNNLFKINCNIWASAFTGPPTNDGFVETFWISGIPEAQTNPATSINPNDAILHGEVVRDCGFACEGRFNYGLTPALGTFTPWQGILRTGDPFQFWALGLTENTLYYFRAEVRNYLETGTPGGTRSFTTGSRVRSLVPVVVTDPATNIRPSEFTAWGRIVDDIGASCAVCFEYGGTPSYGSKTAWIEGFVTGDAFSADIIGLAPGQSYHYRAVARNGYGIGYGQDATVTTLSERGAMTGFPMVYLLMLREDK